MSPPCRQPWILHTIGADSLVSSTGILCSSSSRGHHRILPPPLPSRENEIDIVVPSRQTSPVPSTHPASRMAVNQYGDLSETASLRMQLLERRCQVLELEKEKLEFERAVEQLNAKVTALEAEVKQLSESKVDPAGERSDRRDDSDTGRPSWSEQMMAVDAEADRTSMQDPDPDTTNSVGDRHVDLSTWPEEYRPIRYPDDTYFPATRTLYFHGSMQEDGRVIDSPRSDTGSGGGGPSRHATPRGGRESEVRGHSKVSRIPTPSRWQYPKHAVDMNAIEDLFGQRDTVVADWGYADLTIDVTTDEAVLLRVRDDLQRAGWEVRPYLDSAEKVVVAIDLVVDGTRPDFAMHLVKLYNAADTKVRALARERSNREGGARCTPRDVVDDLPDNLRAIFILWEGYRRPGWVKDLLIRHQCAPHPGVFEPTWVMMTWSWLRGPGVGVVNDAEGRISVRHSEGRGLWRLVAPRELYRPEGVAMGRWEYPESAVWRLFACEGLYGEILTEHRMIVGVATVVADADAEIPAEDSNDLVECARWFAGRGLTPEDGIRLSLYMQELVRDRARGKDHGKEYDEAIWVSRWLVNVRCSGVSVGDDAWFTPDWPRRFRPLSSAVSIRMRKSKHVLPVEDGDDDDTMRELLKEGFDIREYIPTFTGVTQSEGEYSPEGECYDGQGVDSYSGYASM